MPCNGFTPQILLNCIITLTLKYDITVDENLRICCHITKYLLFRFCINRYTINGFLDQISAFMEKQFLAQNVLKYYFLFITVIKIKHKSRK
uniref:Uncharacterized protein n=1 Tax=Anguilla anguilla TaxID=7936 RepID=A0A0E9XR69_ANGAN